MNGKTVEKLRELIAMQMKNWLNKIIEPMVDLQEIETYRPHLDRLLGHRWSVEIDTNTGIICVYYYLDGLDASPNAEVNQSRVRKVVFIGYSISDIWEQMQLVKREELS